MKIVEPIRDKKDIKLIKDALRWKWKIRDLLLFELGINSALRISDILRITVGDVFDEELQPKKNFRTKEKKTGKNGLISITPKVSDTLKLYKEKYRGVMSKPEHYLFFQQKKFDDWKQELGSQHISACMARRLVSGRCKEINLEGSYGTHTLRKTRWFMARTNGVPMELIQHRLNHSSMSVTKRYLGITDGELEKVCNELDL